MFKKKGISVVIGYILLITFAIIISALLYQWLKSYVPRESLECPDGVSLFLKDYIYDCPGENIHITLKNNGRFNIAGYFIYGTNRPDQKLATINLIDYTDAEKGQGAILLGDGNTNTIEPGEEIENNFDLSGSGIERVYSLQIIPVRWQEAENRIKFVTCGKAKIEEELICFSGIPGVCNYNGTCDAGETCYYCPEDCGDCCGNGEIDGGEKCDDGNTEDWNGICSADCSQYQWLVFASSEYYDGFLQGISGGNQKCNALASNAGFTGNFKAWLSDSTQNAKDGINEGIYYLDDSANTIIADNKDDLLDSTIDNPINKDEFGNTLSTYLEVWTGTNEDGTWAGSNNLDCNSWATNQIGTYEGIRGLLTQTDKTWTNYTGADTRCNKNARIYCFQTS